MTMAAITQERHGKMLVLHHLKSKIKIRPHGFRNKYCRNHVPCFLVQKSDITMEIVLKK